MTGHRCSNIVLLLLILMIGKFTITTILTALVSAATPKFNDATYLAKSKEDKQA